MERGIIVSYIAIYREESVNGIAKMKIMERESEKLKVRKEFQRIMDEFKENKSGVLKKVVKIKAIDEK